jgi:hypothetical protein
MKRFSLTALLFLIVGISSHIEAQDATLSETFDFIKLKSNNILLIYSDHPQTFKNSYGDYLNYKSYSSCWNAKNIGYLSESEKEIRVEIQTEFFDGSYEFATYKCVMDLKSVKSIELVGNTIVFSGNQEIVKIEKIPGNLKTKENSDQSKKYILSVDRPRKLEINYGTDAPRILKAYKYLFKLLDIKLLDEMF